MERNLARIQLDIKKKGITDRGLRSGSEKIHVCTGTYIINRQERGRGYSAVLRIRIRIRFVSWIWIRIQLLMKLAPKAKKIHII